MIAELFSQRWTPPVGDANHLGFLAAVLLPLCLAGFQAVRARTGRWWWPALLALGIVAASLVLLATRSRGAWLAASAGLGLLVCLGPGRALRLLALGLLLALVLGILAEPRAAQRAATLLEPAANPSSQQRAGLWQAALVGAWDHPWTGVTGGFTATYDGWFRPADDSWPRPTALSDILQLACEHGMFAAAAVAALVAMLMVALIGRARQKGSAWPMGPAAALLAAWTCLCLAPVLMIPWCRWVLAALIVLAVAGCWRELISSSPLRVALLTALAVVGILLLAGGILARELAFRPHEQACLPRHAAPNLAVAVLPDPDNTPAETTRWILRPLAEAGIAAHLAGTAPPGLPVIAFATCRGRQSAPALILFDIDPALIDRPVTTPVLVCLGRRDPEWRQSAPALPAGVHLRWLPWGRTWPRRFPEAIPALERWLRTTHVR